MIGNGSFFHFLQFRYPEIIRINPFHGRKLPRIKDTRRKDFPTENDIKILRKKFVSLGRKDIVCVIDILSKYGIRIGTFSEMKINENGKWESVSKGKELKGVFTKKEVKQINDSGILTMDKRILTNTFLKYSKKLFEKKLISCPFSPHDLRRYVIDKEGEKYDMKGFIQFSKTFHRSVSTTLGYIS
jgi:predicted nucleic-acid-binding protein